MNLRKVELVHHTPHRSITIPVDVGELEPGEALALYIDDVFFCRFTAEQIETVVAESRRMVRDHEQAIAENRK